LQKNKLSLTDDGSHSVFSSKFQALYHSKHGAIQESMHVFIASGLKHLGKDSVNILEMGFGTGLNALLTMMEVKNSEQAVHYETVEAYPLDLESVSELNYISELDARSFADDFEKLHTCAWGEKLEFKNFSFVKHLVKLEESSFRTSFDLVYFDAFAPLTQEELWTPEIFQHLSTFLNPGAILVSYCAKGSFKRALMSAGFEIEKIPGPPGKREMIRGTYRS